jgi:L-alanine-DL-glutamate epimerase-like enolase superfamily enzyme
MQVAAALGTTDSVIEWHWFDLEATIYCGVLSRKRGRISVPQGPGLGIETDPGSQKVWADIIRIVREMVEDVE